MKKIYKIKKKIFNLMRENNFIKNNNFIFNNIKIVILTARGFKDSTFNLWVSTLTYYTLLSIIPILAIIFAVGKGFGFKNVIERELIEKFPSNTEVLYKVFEFANKLLETTKGGIIAGIGIIVLFWSVIKVLINIENSFNFIWKIKESRHVIRRFSDYLALLFILPVLIFLSSSISVYLGFKIESYKEYLFLGKLFYFLLQFLPYMLIVIFFTIIYMVMPNTKVKIKAALFSSVLVATAYLIFQSIFLKSQIFLVKYNTIYGTFSAIPIFLIWMRFNWLIILFGTQISFAIQNASNFYFQNDYEKISIFNKKILMIMIVYFVAEKFDNGKKSPTDEMISEELEIPPELTLEIINELVQIKIFSRILTEEYNEYAYQPNISIDKITIGYLLDKIETKGDNSILNRINITKETNKELVRKSVEILSENKLNLNIKQIMEKGEENEK